MIYLIVGTKDGKKWLVKHAYLGAAVFMTREDAMIHVESNRVAGIEYAIIETWCRIITR